MAETRRVKITKAAIEAEPLPKTGVRFVWDVELKGFGLKLSPTGVRFIIQRRINGVDRRVKLGRYPEITAEQARNLATGHVGDIAKGEDPVAKRKAAALQAKTLREVMEDYLDQGKARPSTKKDLRGTLENNSPDWLDQPVTRITRDQVSKRYARICKEINPMTGAPKVATGNKWVRYLKAVLNFAMDNYRTTEGKPILTDNATAVLKKRMATIHRRTGHLEPHQIAAWWQATGDLHESARDYLRIMLLTGLRANEALYLKWRDVDLVGRTLTVHNTKNGKDHTLPLGEWLTAMIAARPRRDAYVFSGERGLPTNRRYGIDKVAEATGLEIHRHDLRRSFLTVADAVGVTYAATKALANHHTGDVTQGYIQISVERLREPMRAIEAYILRAAGVLPSAEVFTIDGRRVAG